MCVCYPVVGFLNLMFKKIERGHNLLRSVSFWLVCACFIKSKAQVHAGASSSVQIEDINEPWQSNQTLSPSGSSELKKLSLMTKEGGKSNADSMS